MCAEQRSAKTSFALLKLSATLVLYGYSGSSSELSSLLFVCTGNSLYYIPHAAILFFKGQNVQAVLFHIHVIWYMRK
jgi:hypothetical protein